MKLKANKFLEKLFYYLLSSIQLLKLFNLANYQIIVELEDVWPVNAFV